MSLHYLGVGTLQVLACATLAALLAEVLSSCKTSLALLMVQVYGLYHPFAAAEALRYCCSGELPPTGLLLHF